MKNRIVVISLLVLLGALFLFSCEDNEEKELSASDWIDKGLEYLGKGDGTNAYLAFDKALEIQSGNVDAQYGQVLANILLFKDTIDVLFDMFLGELEELDDPQADAFCSSLNDCDLLDSLDKTFYECLNEAPMGLPEEAVNCIIGNGGNCTEIKNCVAIYLPPDKELCERTCDRMDECGYLDNAGWALSECEDFCPTLYVTGSLECFVELSNCELALEQCFPKEISPIVDILSSPLDDVMNEMFRHMENVLDSSAWNFHVPKYNFTILDLLFQPSLSGQNDAADAYFISTYVNAMGGALDLLFGLNLDINPVLMTAIILDFDDLPDIDFENFTDEDSEAIVYLLEYFEHIVDMLLDDPAYSEFLKVKGAKGIERIEKAGNEIGHVFGSLVNMIDSVDQETDDQSDDAIRFIDANGNGNWDDGEQLLIPGVGLFDRELAFALREVLLSLKINFTEGVPFPLNSMNDLLSYFHMNWVAVILDALYIFDIGELDIASFFNDPSEDALRELLGDVKDGLGIAIILLNMI